MQSSHNASNSRANERFQIVVLPHLNDIRRLTRSLTGGGADADDVLQETTVRLLRFINGYRGGDARSWVLRVTRNTAISWLRTKRRRHHVSLGSDPEAELATATVMDECQDPFAIELRRRDGEALRCAIETLSREQREIVVLRDLNGLRYTEIASVLNIPIGTVMSRLSRGRAAVQARLLNAMGLASSRIPAGGDRPGH